MLVQSGYQTQLNAVKKKNELLDELTHVMMPKLQGTELNNLQHEQKKLNLNIIYSIMLPTVMTRPRTNYNQNAFQQSKLLLSTTQSGMVLLNFINRNMRKNILERKGSSMRGVWKRTFRMQSEDKQKYEKIPGQFRNHMNIINIKQQASTPVSALLKCSNKYFLQGPVKITALIQTLCST
ncbi:Hypothetical_protein [Hexamita inflata]|uniref:Hypothetical_protein n=1 Tax=Hexamita inflata TaxID=28002 RepID=A0ABP1GZ92_9EUKA